MPIPSTAAPSRADSVLGRPGRRCVALMNQSSRDNTLLGVRPSPGPGRGAVSRQSSRDKHRKRSLPGSTVRREGRAISTSNTEVAAPAEAGVVDELGIDQRVRGLLAELTARRPSER